MPLLILVFVALLLIRDYLNETGYIKNLIGRLKTRYRLHKIRQARARKRRELKCREEVLRMIKDFESKAVMVGRFANFGVDIARIAQSFPMFYQVTITTTEHPEQGPNDKEPRSDEEALQDLIKNAVAAEDYESAAIYHDKLKKLYLSQEFKKFDK